MSSLVWTFSEVYNSVSEYLGLGSSPSGDNLTKVKNIVYKGYIKFLTATHPKLGILHHWSFLRQETILKTVSGQNQYLLPDNFWMMDGDINFYPGSGYAPIVKKTKKEIDELRAGSEYSSYPSCYSVSDGQYSTLKRQRKIITLYPTPNGDYSFRYQYYMMPDKPVNATDYFVGGPEISEGIRVCSLAVAEQEEDEFAGQMTNRANQLINSLILADEQENAADSVGPMCGAFDESRILYSRNYKRILQEISDVYGVSITN